MGEIDRFPFAIRILVHAGLGRNYLQSWISKKPLDACTGVESKPSRPNFSLDALRAQVVCVHASRADAQQRRVIQPALAR